MWELSLRIMRERERERGVKGAQSKPIPSPNAFLKLLGRARVKKGGGRARFFFERKILGNYEWELSVDYLGINFWELSGNLLLRIIWKFTSENYLGIYFWELSSRRKVKIYWDTGVSKNKINFNEDRLY